MKSRSEGKRLCETLSLALALAIFKGEMMIKLYNKKTDAYIGEISEAQLSFLVDELAEETYDDQDYYLDEGTLVYLQDNGADAALVALLKKAFDEQGEVEIRWEKA
jgi:hypothetical protein